MEKMRADKDVTKMLYEAAVHGCVVTLNSLIQKDPLILSKISLTNLSETPLHISALLGHLEFTKELLKLKPKLASVLDSLKRSPLHFAAAEGHVEIVRALLQVNKDVCLVEDQDGRIPLHHAAMRGHVHLIELLISARDESVFKLLPSGETVLHLCVQYNHLEALKKLVDSAGCKNSEFLNTKELTNGNTILHLAAMLKQVETIKYLLSIRGVKEQTLNFNSYKAADLLDHLPRDYNRLIIQELRGINDKDQGYLMSCITNHLKAYKGDWLKEMRGSIMVVATVIATMTFQTAINPPGGIWQDTFNKPDIDPDVVSFNCDEAICIAGTSVSAHSWPHLYLQFTSYNSAAFLASLSVVLLIMGGFPLSNKVCVWLLTMAMCVTLTLMALTFLHGMYLVTPFHVVHTINRIYNRSFKVWIGLLALIGLVHTIIFLIWLVKYLQCRMQAHQEHKSRTTTSVHDAAPSDQERISDSYGSISVVLP